MVLYTILSLIVTFFLSVSIIEIAGQIPYGYIHIVPIGVWVVKRVLKNLERIVTIQP